MSANGKLRPDELEQVQGGGHVILLSHATARQYRAMAAEFKRITGFRMTIATPDGGYRSYETQAEMRADWYAHNYARHNLSRVSKIPPAPAGSSSHGFGTRVDIAIGSSWAIDNCERFGFHREFGRDDPNHFMYNGTTLTPEAVHVQPITFTKEELMASVVQSENPASLHYYLYSDYIFRQITQPEASAHNTATKQDTQRMSSEGIGILKKIVKDNRAAR